MEDLIKDAKEELKRVDHLIFVSLKYTRTVDVLRNVVQRLISSFDFIADALLKKALDDKKIESVPVAPKMKCEELDKLYKNDNKILKAVKRYMLLRQIIRAEYEKENEYRRHVALITELEGEEHRIDIDILSEYYQQAQELIEYIEKTHND